MAESVPKGSLQASAQGNDGFKRRDIAENIIGNTPYAEFFCSNIKIGSYHFEATNNVTVTSNGIKITAPLCKHPEQLFDLDIQHSEIIKVAMHFSNKFNVLFIQTKPSCARYINLVLQLTDDGGPFYSPISRRAKNKKIILEIDAVSEETKHILSSIYVAPIFDNITFGGAKEMLMNSLEKPDDVVESVGETSNDELFIYPPGPGGLSITSNDYACLNKEIYLNDVIIDFYLKYLYNEVLSPEKRDRSYIFSQFFYKSLTNMAYNKDEGLSAAQKRHARVANWTKNVDIFKKDFVIVPINQHSHWFVAIVCFSNLVEVKPDANTWNRYTSFVSQMLPGASSRTDKDEAESDEEEETNNNYSMFNRGRRLKKPCILIFDSLGGSKRSQVIATLRQYLTCEYKSKHPLEPAKAFTKYNIEGINVKVPFQRNFTDCGLFVLQYVEEFLHLHPFKVRLPIQNMEDWFHQDEATRKREAIANLIYEKMCSHRPDAIVQLPPIEFPTKDGEILKKQQREGFYTDNYGEDEISDRESVNGSDYDPIEDNTGWKSKKTLKDTAEKSKKKNKKKLNRSYFSY